MRFASSPLSAAYYRHVRREIFPVTVVRKYGAARGQKVTAFDPKKAISSAPVNFDAREKISVSARRGRYELPGRDMRLVGRLMPTADFTSQVFTLVVRPGGLGWATFSIERRPPLGSREHGAGGSPPASSRPSSDLAIGGYRRMAARCRRRTSHIGLGLDGIRGPLPARTIDVGEGGSVGFPLLQAP